MLGTETSSQAAAGDKDYREVAVEAQMYSTPDKAYVKALDSGTQSSGSSEKKFAPLSIARDNM